MRQHGGARPGAGRPPKAIRYAAITNPTEQKIADALPEITDVLIGAAKQGDLSAARYLCDRILGRVPVLEAVPAEDRRPEYTEAEAELDAEIFSGLRG